ncbi:MAG: hypothetical protein U0359_34740 [Byssovorax sp.]
MPAPIIAQDASLATVLEENTITLARLKANPLTTDFAQAFVTFQDDWGKVNTQEISLRIALISANAAVNAVDDQLDPLVDALAAAVLLQTKNDRKAPLYQLYFGNQRPSELKRPVLGQQLETMRGFLPSLATSPVTTLTEIGQSMAMLIDEADIAVKALAKAEQENRDFRAVGPRKALIDQLNAQRKLTYGQLSEMPHALPDEHLPATFAEQFFRHDKGRSNGKAATLADLAELVKSKEAELAALKEELLAAQQKEEAAAKAKAQLESDKAALAQAEKDAAEAAAKVEALKAKLGADS